MQSVKLGEAIEKIGGRVFFPKSFSELYLYAGIDSIENLIKNKMTKPQKCGIMTGKNGIVLSTAILGKFAYVGIPFNEIKSIYYIGGAEKESDTADNITKAISGAMIAGPIGLLAGVLNDALNSERILICIKTQDDSIILGTQNYFKQRLDNFFQKICPTVFNPNINI